MISSNSVWQRRLKNKTRSAAFSLKESSVGFSFDNRGIGQITFSSEPRNLNESRQEIIDKSYGEKTLNGYKYKTISHSHIRPTILNEELEVLSHGVPVKQGWENCAMLGMECSEGESNTKCNVGKCVIGRVIKQEEVDRWKYESYNVAGLYYFMYGREYIDLQSVMRGDFILPGGLNTVQVDKIASTKSRIYLPPNTYSNETFTRRVIKFLDPNSIQDSVNIFVRTLLSTEFFATAQVEIKLFEKVVFLVSSTLPGQWSEFVKEVVEEVWEGRCVDTSIDNRDFLVLCYEALSQLYKNAIQVASSSFNRSEVTIDADICRPVYDRLPGISGAYNTDESESNVSSWLVSGADMELSKSKVLIDTFYKVFLDPETCYPPNLDWIAQHMGFFGSMWNLEWSSNTKRLLLRNAHKNDLVEDGVIWTTDPEESTLQRIDFSYTEEILGGGVETGNRYWERVYDDETELVSLQPIDSIIADISTWPGLIPSRGSKMAILFMFWVFSIKAPSLEEFEAVTGGGYKVKSGLRQLEFNAPVNMPLTYDVLHVGSESDLQVNNYSNQLVADISVCYDVNRSNTIVLRMPFYYNRDGITWDTAQSIMDNWVPSTAAKRVQYGYAVADLLLADDILFTIESELVLE